MKAREYLSQGRRIQDRIDALRKQKDLVMSTTVRLRATISGGGDNSRKAETAVQLIDELNRQIDKLETTKLDIIRTIDKITTNEYAAILIDHYLNDITLYDISMARGYDYKTIQRWHDKGLSIVQRMIDKNKRV